MKVIYYYKNSKITVEKIDTIEPTERIMSTLLKSIKDIIFNNWKTYCGENERTCLSSYFYISTALNHEEYVTHKDYPRFTAKVTDGMHIYMRDVENRDNASEDEMFAAVEVCRCFLYNRVKGVTEESLKKAKAPTEEVKTPKEYNDNTVVTQRNK